MSGWYPIEVAPKDGTEVIGIHFREWEGMTPSVYGPWTIAFKRGQWRSSWDGCQVIESETDFGTTYKEPDCDPTHWQPMPAPPTALKTAQGEPK